ncbi:MAG: PP2C family protein-serine/threonine phosphatase [Tenuifilaceae bacterium]
MENLKIKIYGILPVTRIQFVIGYSFFFIFFIVMMVFFLVFPQPIPTHEISFLEMIFYKYPIHIFLFFLVWIVIEGIFYWNRFIKAQNQIIENQKNQIELRNINLEEQKEEIITQRDEIEAQRDLVVSQMDIISHQKKQLTDSIQYAYRIQCAVLPPEHYINQCLPNCFILYLPKDVVSGDFYFIEKSCGKTIVAAVDCTGHGVPGAMMSVIGYNLLNQAVKINKLTKPSEILGFLDVGVTEVLRQVHNESGVKDGMDLSILCIDQQTLTFEFAGAYNSIYYIHNKQLSEEKADKLEIGVNEDGVADVYTNHIIEVSKGDMVYMFTDGYADQFGGPQGKKFKYKQLEETLIEISEDSLDVQKQKINKKFDDWKGNEEQVDDVLVIGIRV